MALDAALPATPEEKLFTVLPSICELAGAAGSVAISGVSRLFHQAVVRGRESNAIWIGIAMREYGPEARAHTAAAGADAMLSTDWRKFVLDRLRSGNAAAA